MSFVNHLYSENNYLFNTCNKKDIPPILQNTKREAALISSKMFCFCSELKPFVSICNLVMSKECGDWQLTYSVMRPCKSQLIIIECSLVYRFINIFLRKFL